MFWMLCHMFLSKCIPRNTPILRSPPGFLIPLTFFPITKEIITSLLHWASLPLKHAYNRTFFFFWKIIHTLEYLQLQKKKGQYSQIYGISFFAFKICYKFLFQNGMPCFDSIMSHLPSFKLHFNRSVSYLRNYIH